MYNQPMNDYIRSRGVSSINTSILSNSVIVAIYFWQRYSVMTGIHRGSMMVSCSLQTVFIGTKHNVHIHRYGTLILAILMFMSLNRLTLIIKFFGGCKIRLDSIYQVFLHKNGSFSPITCIINSRMDALWIVIIYSTVGLTWGDMKASQSTDNADNVFFK